MFKLNLPWQTELTKGNLCDEFVMIFSFINKKIIDNLRGVRLLLPLNISIATSWMFFGCFFVMIGTSFFIHPLLRDFHKMIFGLCKLNEDNLVKTLDIVVITTTMYHPY